MYIYNGTHYVGPRAVGAAGALVVACYIHLATTRAAARPTTSGPSNSAGDPWRRRRPVVARQGRDPWGAEKMTTAGKIFKNIVLLFFAFFLLF